MRKILFAIFIFLLFSLVANAQLNAKTMDYVKIKIIQGGTLTAENVEIANLSYYIPQQGVLDIRVVADGSPSWRYIFDSFGNKLVLMEWKKPAGTINYRIELTVENSAKHTLTDKAVGTDDFYLKETGLIKIDDAVRQAAFPFEKSMKRAAELTKFVYDYVDYDLSYVGKNIPSNQVLTERRGVCVEHANLLTALLRANEIPTRYVVGYAYSSVQNKFIGHTWVEVLAEDGSWVPFDPTWLQGGYIDATHIKSAVLLDNSQIDTLTYLGGRIGWKRDEEKIDLLDYREKTVTSITATGTDAASNGYGYIKGSASANECTLTDVTANSCIDGFGDKQLDIHETNRTLWLCRPKDIYWFFYARNSNYICPVLIYDQLGGSAEHRVTVQGLQRPAQLSISGPDTAGTSESFTLTASTDGIFYSPEFGLHSGNWLLNIKSPGIYKFYLYNDGNLYIKTVTVVQKKEFGLDVTAPASAKLKTLFDVNVTVKSLLDSATPAVTVKYTNQTFKRTLALEKGEQKTIQFRLDANREGLNELVVTATGNSLVSQTALINTPFEKGFLDGIIDAIAGFFSAIANAIGSLFGGK